MGATLYMHELVLESGDAFQNEHYRRS
jgi:hypothetical protein